MDELNLSLLNAARHCFERQCFTRYAEDCLRGEKNDAEVAAYMATAMKDFDAIVARAFSGDYPAIYAEKAAEVHDYGLEMELLRKRIIAKTALPPEEQLADG